MKTARKCRINRNIFTKKELKELLELIPEKYKKAFQETPSMDLAAEISKAHRNSIHFTVKKFSKQITGIPMTFPAIKRSMILQELIKTGDWLKIEGKYGRQMLYTAAAEFVRSYPESLALIA